MIRVVSRTTLMTQVLCRVRHWTPGIGFTARYSQRTEQENTNDRNLLKRTHIQGPHCRHGEYEDGEVGNHIGYGANHKENPLVDTGAMNTRVFVPDILNRVTLEGHNKDDHNCPA